MKGVIYPGEDDYPHITWEILKKAHSKYLNDKSKDEIYEASLGLVEYSWPEIKDLSLLMGILLLAWNPAFYRIGDPDFGLIEIA